MASLPPGGDAGEDGSDGRVQAGPRGARRRSGAKFDFRARTFGSSAQGHALRTEERAGEAGGRGSGRKGMAGGSGGAQNAISMQRPYGAGVGQKGRDGRLRTGRHGWRVWRSTECDFAQRPYAIGSRPAAPGWPGFRPRRHGWRLWRGTEFDFRAPTQCNVGRAGNAGMAGFGPDEAAGGCGGARNAIFVQRPYEPGAGRGGRGAGQFYSCVDQEADPGAPFVDLRPGATFGQRARSAEREHHDMPGLPSGAAARQSA
jgi:hypothetical protein